MDRAEGIGAARVKELVGCGAHGPAREARLVRPQTRCSWAEEVGLALFSLSLYFPLTEKQIERRKRKRGLGKNLSKQIIFLDS